LIVIRPWIYFYWAGRAFCPGRGGSADAESVFDKTIPEHST